MDMFDLILIMQLVVVASVSVVFVWGQWTIRRIESHFHEDLRKTKIDIEKEASRLRAILKRHEEILIRQRDEEEQEAREAAATEMAARAAATVEPAQRVPFDVPETLLLDAWLGAMNEALSPKLDLADEEVTDGRGSRDIEL